MGSSHLPKNLSPDKTRVCFYIAIQKSLANCFFYCYPTLNQAPHSLTNKASELKGECGRRTPDCGDLDSDIDPENAKKRGLVQGSKTLKPNLA